MKSDNVKAYPPAMLERLRAEMETEREETTLGRRTRTQGDRGDSAKRSEMLENTSETDDRGEVVSEPVISAGNLPADPLFSLEGARELLASIERLGPEDATNLGRPSLWVSLREACDEVEWLTAEVNRVNAERARLVNQGIDERHELRVRYDAEVDRHEATRVAAKRLTKERDASAAEVASLTADLAQARATIETMRLAADQEAERVKELEREAASADQTAHDLAKRVRELEAVLADHRRRVDHGGKITADLYAIAAKLGANLPKPEARYAEDAVLRVQHGVSELQRAHAKAECSRDRWEARARRAEERVEALTVERDDANQRVACKVAGQVRRKAKRKAARTDDHAQAMIDAMQVAWTGKRRKSGKRKGASK